jgi:ribosomal protein L11 methyltransferase
MTSMTSWSYTLPRAATPDDDDLVGVQLWDAGALGVWIRPDDLIAYFDEQTEAVPSGGTWAEEPDRDYLAEWRASIDPVAAGRFDIVPTWRTDEFPEQDGRVRIVLDPGRAFGSGHHDTTSGCLEELGASMRDGDRVLDVGTGTGVLAIAAARLGAGEVRGVDLDVDAIEVAGVNATDNGVNIDLHVGSVGDAGDNWDVVLANLLTHTIVSLSAPLVAALRLGGTLIVSGVSWDFVDEAVEALEGAGLVDIVSRQRGEWAIVTGHRPHAGAA